MALIDIHWVVILILLPMLSAVLCFLWPRKASLIGFITAIGMIFTTLGLIAQVLQQGAIRYALGGWDTPLGIELYVDGLSLVMISITTLIGIAISIYSSAYFKVEKAKYFWPLWLLLWSALNSLFLSGDIFNLYVTLELVGLAAVALVALSGGADALKSAMRYLFISLLGSLFYLMGVALLYHGYGTVDISLLSQRVESSPIVWVAMGLMISGLLLKTALFPMHFWLPPAHSSAPAPVSALLSALVVKSSFYILLRLWLEVFPVDSLPQGQLLAQFIGLLGAGAIIWGGIQALRQTRLKLLIAYSTVVQIGYLFLAFPLASVLGWKAALYVVIAHAVAKTAMFMAAGNILYYQGHDRIKELAGTAQNLPITLAAFGLAGVSLMGLPPSGGFIAKWLYLEAVIVSGQWWWGIPLVIGGLLTAAYIFKVIGFAFMQAEAPQDFKAVPKRMQLIALVLATVAIMLGFLSPFVLPIMDIGAPFNGVSS